MRPPFLSLTLSLTLSLALAAASLLPLVAQAQVPEPEQIDTKAEQPADYCTLIFEGDGNPDKFYALDFGKGAKTKAYDANQLAIVDKIKSMTSVTRAINHLSQKGGWDLNNTYATRDGSRVYHYYIFRRK
jgi:hypothetical protein